MDLIDNIESAWISYQEQVVNVYADCHNLKFNGEQLTLTFPYNPALCEELNCIVKGVAYQIQTNHALKICFETQVTRSPFEINNYTKLPLTIDFNSPKRPVLVYTDSDEIEIVSEINTPLTNKQVRFKENLLVECSKDLIGKKVFISCNAIIHRWVKTLNKQKLGEINCYLASTNEVQMLVGEIIVLNNVDLYQDYRIVALNNLKEIKREKI